MQSLVPLMRQQVRDVLRGDRGWLTGAWSGGLLILLLTIPKLVWIRSIGYPTPFLLYLVATMVATYRGGIFAGLLTTLGSALVSLGLFMDASLPDFWFRGATALLVFCIEGVCVSLITGGFVVQKRKAAEASADASSATIQRDVVLSGLDEGITLQDRQGRTIYANRAAAHMAGCASPEEFLSTFPAALATKFELFDSDGHPVPLNEIPGRRLLRGLPASEVKLRVRRRDTGAEHWALLRANAILGKDDQLEYVVSVFRDVTEKQQREAELEIAREWFQIALRSIGDAVITTDAKGRINSLNPVAEKLTGYGCDDALGRPLEEIFRIVAEDTREPVESPVGRVLQDGLIVGLANHTLLLRPDGSEIAIDDSAAPIKRSDGQLEGVILVFRDVSSKRLEEKRAAFLARATQELSSDLDYHQTLSKVARLAVPTIADWCAVDILEAGEVVRLGVAHVDEAKIRFVEELARRYPSDPDAAQGVHAILRTGKSQMLPEIPAELLEAAARDEAHKKLIFHLGLHSYMGVPLQRQGRAFGVITFATAESKRTFNEQDLALAEALADRAALAVENASLYQSAEEARRQAEAANHTKDEFLAMLGHELRNPLAPICSALDLIERVPGLAHRQPVGVIRRQVEHLVRLVDDLLDVARITNGRLELEYAVVPFQQIVDRAKEIVWPALTAPSHRVHFDIEPGLSLKCDRVRMAQVIANLLANSVKYTAEGGNIWVNAHSDQGSVVIRVQDDGIGIGPATLREVFDLFVQAPQALDRARGGLGLGLAIVKGLVSAHGGTVRAHSDGIGRGAEFVVEVPTGDLSEQQDRPPVAETHASRSRRILLVDDNQDARELLGQLLEAVGHEVMTAPDGPTALALAKRNRPEVALLDIGLPGMNGYELASELRKLEGLESIQLIAVTGYGQADDRSRSKLAKFKAHLVKPVYLETLQEVLDRVFPERRTG